MKHDRTEHGDFFRCTQCGMVVEYPIEEECEGEHKDDER